MLGLKLSHVSKRDPDDVMTKASAAMVLLGYHMQWSLFLHRILFIFIGTKIILTGTQNSLFRFDGIFVNT